MEKYKNTKEWNLTKQYKCVINLLSFMAFKN